jgi:hypothetical protein
MSCVGTLEAIDLDKIQFRPCENPNFLLKRSIFVWFFMQPTFVEPPQNFAPQNRVVEYRFLAARDHRSRSALIRSVNRKYH